jgi:hypothetical protein
MVVESMIYNWLSDSIFMRQSFLQIQVYSKVNDTIGIIRETVSVIKRLAWFNNIYVGIDMSQVNLAG